MRLRNIPGADEIVATSAFCIQDPAQYRGEWFRLLGNEHQIHIEIGMGKGQFLMELAARHPNINYIGVERYTSVLLRAVQKMEKHPLPNLHFLCINAETLPDIFERGEVDQIYLNFSDPWPKDRHAKRRLTSSQNLRRYAEILAEDGTIEFKTDNKKLFAFSLEELERSDIFQLDSCTWDLHHDPVMNEGNIMTEYEEKFSGMGNPICKLIASYQDGAYDRLEAEAEAGNAVTTDVKAGSTNATGSKEGDADTTNTGSVPIAECLRVSVRPEGMENSNTYRFVIRLDHSGHHSYGQTVLLTLSVSVGIAELPSDVEGSVFGNTITLTRHNQLTENGMTEMWIKLTAESRPEIVKAIGIKCEEA